MKKFWIVVSVREGVRTAGPSLLVADRCAPVCGYRAGYLGAGLAQLWARIRLEIEDFLPDP